MLRLSTRAWAQIKEVNLTNFLGWNPLALNKNCLPWEGSFLLAMRRKLELSNSTPDLHLLNCSWQSISMHSNCLSAKGRVYWDRLKHTSSSESIPVSSGAVSWPKVALHHTLLLFTTSLRHLCRCARLSQLSSLSTLSLATRQDCPARTLGLRLLCGWLPHWAADGTDPNCFFIL